MASQLLRTPGGWVFQTDSVEVQVTDDDAKDLISSVLVIVDVPEQFLKLTTANWLGKRDN
jgi:hypothetical protein